MERSRLDHPFFARPADAVAPDLIGKILVRRVAGQEYRGRIVETEAYLGPPDLASHASKGLTKRTRILLGPPGRAYIYFIYGMHQMFNIVTWRDGGGHAVLVRAAEPWDHWEADLAGPGKLAKAFHITPAENGIDLTGDALFVLDNPDDHPRIARDKRIGVDYAGRWKDRLLRFADKNSPALSKPIRR